MLDAYSTVMFAVVPFHLSKTGPFFTSVTFQMLFILKKYYKGGCCPYNALSLRGIRLQNGNNVE